MEIVWRQITVEDLIAARRFIAEDNPKAAQCVYPSIVAAVERLSAFPNLGKPGRVAGTRELFVPGTPYVVAYRVVDDRLRVLGVLHGAQEWPERF